MLNSGFDYRERLGRRAAGRTVFAYLSDRYRHSSPREWRRRIEAGQVFIEGAPAAAEGELASGETLVFRRPPWREPEAPTSFAVFYRDHDLLAVAKPAGLPTLPGGGFLENTLLRRVRRVAPGASPLRRLGRGTSGLVLFTLNRTARRVLASAWARGEVERGYRAIVSGAFPQGETILDFPIGPVPHPVLGSVAGVNAKGKRARSRVRLIEHRGETSLVEVSIETGRTNQIRIHLATFGYPLAGDRLYGANGAALPGETGYLLHAHRLAFRHPRSSAPVEILWPPKLYRGSAE
jgi:23S rRNA pseudouridine1911/1915/1917 synthase